MHTIRVIFDLCVVAALAYVGITFYLQYREEKVGTVWQKSLAAARDSATILWTKFCAALALIVYQLDNIADLVGMPEAKDFINNWIGNPKAISGIMLLISLVTFWARTRKASSNPV